MSLIAQTASRLHRIPVAIIGGGVEAFTAALSLHRGGIPNNIFLRHGTLTHKSRYNVFIGGSAIRILDRLGLGSEYRSLGTPIHRVGIEDIRGNGVVSFELDGMGTEVWSVPCDHLLQVFLEAIPPESVTFDAKFRTLSVDDSGAEVTLEQSRDYCGPLIPSRNISCESDFVIGADGPSSAVRTFMSRSVMSIPSGATVWRAVVPNTDTKSIPLHVAKEVWHTDRRFGFVRTSQEEVMWWAVVSNVEAVILRPFTPHLMRLFSNFPPMIHDLISSTDADRNIHREEMKRVVSEQSPWVDKSSRMALVGEAARPGTAEVFHSNHSFAVEDSYFLANILIDQKDRGLLRYGPQLDQYQESREDQMAVSDKLSRVLRRLTAARSTITRYLARTKLNHAVVKVAAEGMSTVIPTVAQVERIPKVMSQS